MEMTGQTYDYFDDKGERLLWWDDSSYAAYQAYDPYWDEDPDAWRYLLTEYSPDYCNGGYVHADHCQKVSKEDMPPF